MIRFTARDAKNEFRDVIVSAPDLDTLIQSKSNATFFCEDNDQNQYHVAKCWLEFGEVLP